MRMDVVGICYPFTNFFNSNICILEVVCLCLKGWNSKVCCDMGVLCYVYYYIAILYLTPISNMSVGASGGVSIVFPDPPHANGGCIWRPDEKSRVCL